MLCLIALEGTQRDHKILVSTSQATLQERTKDQGGPIVRIYVQQVAKTRLCGWLWDCGEGAAEASPQIQRCDQHQPGCVGCSHVVSIGELHLTQRVEVSLGGICMYVGVRNLFRRVWG